MTVGTNALLEGRVARTALLATEGFTDLEELGPPGARGAVPAVRGAPAAARAGRAARGRCRSGPGRTACCGRSTRTRSARPSTASTPRRPPSASCGASAIPSTSGAWPSSLEEARAGHPRVDVTRDGRRVPRVRALRDDRGRRRALAAPARVPRAAHRARPRRRAAGARGDAVERRHGERPATAARHALVDGAVGAGRRGGGSGADGRPTGATRSGSTWAARRATCR